MTKKLCEHTLQANIRTMVQNRCIDVGAGTATLVRVDGRKQRISLTSYRTGFGWVPLFLCPSCRKRAAILYSNPNFACRGCHALAYASEQETRASRKLRKAGKIRIRLGQETGGIAAPFPAKPKWMRWHTYLRTQKRSESLERQAWKSIALHAGLAWPRTDSELAD